MGDRTVVIFGATGTLGLYLTDSLARKQDSRYSIVATGRKEVSYFERVYGESVRYQKVDITDEESFSKLPQENVTAVVHFAGALPAYMAGYDPRAYVSSNVMGTLNVLEYARQVGAQRVMFTQTISDYDGYFGQRTELLDDMPTKFPLTGDHAVYAITKTCAFDLCRQYEAEYGIAAFGFRLPNIYCYMPEAKTLYHDGKPARSSYRYMIELASQGKDLEVWGDPKKGMDLIYVKDFCQMVEAALEADPSASGMYNVGTGVMTPLEVFVADILDVFSPAGHKGAMIYRPDKHDCVNYFMNVDKARRQLGYEPHFTPLAMLEDYKKEIEENRFAAFFDERYGSSDPYLDSARR